MKTVLLIIGGIIFVMVLVFAGLAFYSHQIEPVVGVIDGELPARLEKPNNVSSDASSDSHRVAPFVVQAAADWQRLVSELGAMEGISIVEQSENYVHAVAVTPLLRYADDVELHYRPKEGIAAVRSSSRTGYSDLDTNRYRVERLRLLYEAK